MYIIHLNHVAEERVFLIDKCKIPCFGLKANEIFYVDRDDIEYARAIVDTETEECRLLEVMVPGYNQAFQWIHPEYRELYQKYLSSRHLPNLVFNSPDFSTMESEEQILIYLRDVGSGYYDDLPIPN